VKNAATIQKLKGWWTDHPYFDIHFINPIHTDGLPNINETTFLEKGMFTVCKIGRSRLL